MKFLDRTFRRQPSGRNTEARRGQSVHRGARPMLERLEDRLAPATYNWASSTGGDWNTPSNWSPNGVPGPGDDAVIGNLTGVQTITYSGGTSTIRSLSMAENVTIAAGSLTITGSLTISPGLSMRVDGALAVSGANVIAQENSYTGYNAIVVNGTMTATNTTFSQTGGWGSSNFLVGVGGRLTGSNNTFAFSNMSFAAGSLLGAGELTTNRFNLPLTVPARFVPLLANNRSFQDVRLLTDTLTSGESLTLAPLGTDTPAAQRYVLSGNFTVAAGASLDIAANARVQIPQNISLSVAGSLTVGTGASIVVAESAYAAFNAITVSGTMTTTSASFTQTGNWGSSNFQIVAGGRLTGSNNTFAVSRMGFAAGSLLSAGDVTNNGFDLPLTVPIGHVALLADNRRFRDINLLGTTLTAGQSLTLSPIGTDTTANQRYVFVENSTVAAGATLTVAPNTSLAINQGGSLSIAGTLTVSSGVSVVAVEAAATFNALVVSGTMIATGASFTRTGGWASSTLQVNLGGQLTLKESTFAWGNLNTTSGSEVTLQSLNYSGKLTLNAGAAVTAQGNDFSNVANNGIIAIGTPTFNFDLRNNYWATTNLTTIGNRILDYNDSPVATRPTVLFDPPMTGRPADASGNSTTTTFQVSANSVTLTAGVTSPSGVVNEGTLTFTILDGATPIGTAVTVPVISGLATANYTLPAATPVGIYTIRAVYNGTINYASTTDTSKTLTIVEAHTTTTTSNRSTSYRIADQTLSLSANVASPGGTINVGTLTFTILSGSTIIGNAVSVNVTNGVGTAVYTLPGGTAPGTYTIQATYASTGNFATSVNTATLTLDKASTTTSTNNVSIPYNALGQSVSLSATLASAGGTLNEGTVTFAILSGTTPIGTPVTVDVTANSAGATYMIPGNIAAGSYTLRATYNGNDNFSPSLDNRTLTITAPVDPTVSIALDSGSASGAPAFPTFTNDVTPTFNVTVNQPGTIRIDFDGDGSPEQTMNVSASGTYAFTSEALTDNAYTARVSFEAGLAGTAQASSNYTIDTVRPVVLSSTATGTIRNAVSRIDVTFSEPINLNTFGASAISLIGPAGAITVNAPTLLSGNTYRFTFPLQTSEGAYTLSISSSVAGRAANTMASGYTTGFSIALPDLAIASATAPSSAIVGASVPISWLVQNISATNPTGGTWNDAVYLSNQPVVNGASVLLTSVAGPATPLEARVSYSRSRTVSLPSNVPTGAYFLVFVANSDGGQAEVGTGSNIAARPIQLSAPDLVPSSVSGATNAFAGQTVLLSWTLTNQGDALASGPWVDRVYLVSDTQGANPVLLGNFLFESQLAPGASVVRTQQIVLPNVSGTRWFQVVTNATGTVGEGLGSTNNAIVSATSIHIEPVPLPDLVVTTITPPASGVFSGNRVEVSFTIRNQGQGPTSVPRWRDWIILSQDANLADTYSGQLNAFGPGGDQVLTAQPIVICADNPSFLSPGESYSQTVEVALPLDARGLWYVYVVPDGTGARHPFSMPQASRTNKLARSTGFSITLTPPPDLQVSSVQAPEQNFSGSMIPVNWTVTNIGNGTTVADSWQEAIYLSEDDVLDANDRLLASFRRQGPLLAGASYAVREMVDLPVGLSGQFHFLVRTDVRNEIFEDGATANNVAASAVRTINLTPPPDLEVVSVTAPTNAVAGRDVSFSYTVRNFGSTATPNYTWTDSLYLSPTVTFNPATAIPLGARQHQGRLDIDASYTQQVSVRLPSGLLGNYYLFVATDTSNVVFELNDDNNRASALAPVVITQAPADLVVTSASAPMQVLAGTAIQVNWTVSNQSSNVTQASSWIDEVYITPQATLDSSAVRIGSFTRFGTLAGGASYSRSELVTVPIQYLGNYNVFVVTNALSTLNESSTSNNRSTALPISVERMLTTPTGPVPAAVADLQVVSVNSSLSGNSATVTWVVQNVGTGPTNATAWNDDVWLSTQPRLGTGGRDIFLGSRQRTNPLAAGASYTASGTYALPTGLIADNYYFIVATDRPIRPPSDLTGDGAGRVFDLNLGNNQQTSPTAQPLTPAPLADLVVSSITAPTVSSSGGQLSLSWSVTNNGAATGNVTLTDTVYLSFDQVFDSTTDRAIGSFSRTGNLLNGESYTQSVVIPLPGGVAGTFYIFVRANSNRRIAESDSSNNTAKASNTVQLQLLPTVDLVAGTVTIPTEGLAGQNITITYQVTNAGQNAANGFWYDSLYLSRTPTWNVDTPPPLLGRLPQSRNLAAGASYTDTLTATLPGLAPGTYHVLVRTNILQTVTESNRDNNLSASLTQTSIDAPSLTLGSPVTFALGQDQSVYYKVIVASGQTLRVTLDSLNVAAGNELYVSYGTMPTRSRYDFRFSRPFEPNQVVTVPTTRAGVYYILAHGADVPGNSQSATLRAALVPFSVQAVTPGQAGAGSVTLRVSGARFESDTRFELRNASGVVLPAARVLVQDSATAFATFDLAGRQLGSYDIWAIRSDNSTTHLANGLNVVAPQHRDVEVNLVLPSAVLVGRPGTLSISYSNPGNTDIPAPFLQLVGDNTLFQIPGQTDFTQNKLQLIGFNPDGPYGILPPGFRGHLTVSFQPIIADEAHPARMSLSMLADPGQPFDWNALASNGVPVQTSPQQWAELVAQASTVLGTTWGDVLAFLGRNTVQLIGGITGNTNPAGLYSLADFNSLLRYAVGVYGTPAPVPGTPPLPLLATEGQVRLYNGNLDSDGNPRPLVADHPTYILVPGWGGYRNDFRALAAAIAHEAECFGGGRVNVLVATWDGAAAELPGLNRTVPWMASLQVDDAGTALGNLIAGLIQQSRINGLTTTLIGEGLGSYVGNQAARIAGGLGNTIALNPASALGGYLPPRLTDYFQNSTAYATASFFETQSALARSNQTIPVGDLNNPLLLSRLGVAWLTQQVQRDRCELLHPTYKAGPDELPPVSAAIPTSCPLSVLVTRGAVPQIRSQDPNSIIGPLGDGDNKLVPVEEVLPYTILFENLPTVTAPAQRIVIRQQLDSNLDWRTFRLTGFGFRGQDYFVPINSAFHQTIIDLGEALGFHVLFTGTIDVRTGIASWIFSTIDPATGEAPLDPTLGLLPPNVANRIGEGFVSYTISSLGNTSTGEIVNAQATIVFDVEPPLDTNLHFNTIDAGTDLSSQVSALPSVSRSDTFQVSWSGLDGENGSGIASYTIYVAVNDGPFAPWLLNTTLTSAPFKGEDGHTYRFYSIARTHSGIVENPPAEPDATIVVDLTAPSSSVTALLAYSAGTFTVSWSGTDGTGSGITSYRILVSEDGGPFTAWLTDTPDTSAIFTGVNGRTYAFYSIATDAAGLVEEAPGQPDTSTLIDSLAPTSAVTALPAFSPGTFTVSWSGTDDSGSGLTSYRIRVSTNGGPFADWITHTTDTSATFNGIDGITYRFYSIATDAAGNVETAPTQPDATTTVDTAPPSSAVTALPGFSSDTFLVSWTGSDGEGSGVALFRIFVSENGGAYTLWQSSTSSSSALFAGVNGRTYSFYSIATDYLGLIEPIPSQADATTTVDIAAPTSSVHILPGFSPGSFTVSWSGSDGLGSGIASYDVYVSVDGAAPTLWMSATTATSATYLGVSNRLYGFFTRARDVVGNLEVAPSQPDTTTRVDLDLPTSNVSSLPAFSPGSFLVSWSGSDGAGSGIASFRILVSENGGPYTTWLANTAATSAVFAGVNGRLYSFYSVATDLSGNVELAPVLPDASTRVDMLAPTVVQPTLPAYSQASFSLNWSASDGLGAGVASYTVFVSENSGPWNVWLPSTTQTAANFTGTDGNTYAFRVLATDGVGNTSEAPATTAATTTVDTTPPSSSTTSPAFATTNPSFPVFWSGNDSVSGVTSYTVFVSVNGGAYEVWQPATTATFAVYSGLVGNSYAFYSIATDQVGNVETVPPRADVVVGVAPAAVTLRRSGNTVQLFDPAENRVIAVRPIDDTSPLVVSGVNALTLDLASGGEFTLAGGIRFEAGGSLPTFTLRGSTLTTVSVTPGATQQLVAAGTTITLIGVASQELFGLQQLTLASTGGSDSYFVDTPTTGRTRITGTGLPSLVFFDTTNLTVDLATGDTANHSNTLTVNGPWSASGLRNVTVLGGAGRSTLTHNALSLALPVSGGNYSFYGSAQDTLIAQGNTNWTLTDSGLSSSVTGSLLGLSGITTVTLNPINGGKVLDATGFSGTVFFPGGLGNQLRGGSGATWITASGDVHFTLTNTTLVQRNRTTNAILTTDQLTGIRFARLTGGIGNNILDASGFSGTTYLSGGLGNDTIRGGTGFNWLVESGNVNFALTNTRLIGLGTDTLTRIQGALLTGGKGNNTFTLTGWTGQAILNGDEGTNSLVVTSNSNFTLSNSLLRRNGTGDISLTGIQVARLTGGTGNNVFDLSDWSGQATLSGGGGIDTLVANNDADFTLGNTLLRRSGRPDILLAGIRNARLSGGAGDNIFTVSSWTGSATLDGGSGSNTIVASNNVHFTLSDTLLQRVGSSNILLSGFTSALLTGGISANNFDISNWTGTATLTGGGGADVLIASGNTSYALSNTLLHRTGVGAVALIGFGSARLTGGASNNSFDVSGWTGTATLNGVAGVNTVVAASNTNFTLSNTRLRRTGNGDVTLTAIGIAHVSGGPDDNLFDVSGWTLGGSVTGGGGRDMLLASNSNVNFTLTDTLLQRSGFGNLSLSGIATARLITPAGNTRLDASGFSGKATLVGGTGNNTLLAAQGASVLVGGGGADTLVGNLTASLLIGGDGRDTLSAGSAGDLLIAGSTIYDSNWKALEAILAEWSRTDRTYAERIAALRTGVSSPAVVLKRTTSVRDDLFSNTLQGGSGLDWFWCKVSGSVAEAILNRSPEEQVN